MSDRRMTTLREQTTVAAPSPMSGLGGLAAAALTLLLPFPAATVAQTVPFGGAAPDVPAANHEPVFGIGPQTIWDGGIGAGLDGHVSRHASTDGDRSEEELELHAHLDYGVTENLTVRAAMPLVKRKTETALVPGSGTVSSSATGAGNLTVRAKYRFWHEFSGSSTQYHASAVGGAVFPSGATATEPAVASGGTDYLAGATVSRDGLRYYVWTSGIARMNGGLFAGSRENEYRYDAAFGYRPWVPSFTGVDPLLLLEFNGVTVTEDGSEHGHDETASAATLLEGPPPRTDVGAGGGTAAAGSRTILALSPSFWLTYRNFAWKGGVKLPVYQDVGGGMELDYALVTEFEIHL